MACPSGRVVLPFVASILAVPLAAQWQLIPVSQAPTPRTDFRLLPTSDGDLLLFGGDAANPAATEWLWNGLGWQPVTTPVPRRNGPAVAALSTGPLLVFGGVGAAGGALSDTWRFTPATGWQLVPTTTQPIGLSELSMIGEPGSGRAVLIGRNGGNVETWFFALGGSDWTAGPVFPTAQAALAADSVRGEVVLFRQGAGAVEALRLAAQTWQPVATLPSLGIAGIGFDPARGRATLLQPFANQAIAEWDGLRFVSQQPASGAAVPSSRTAIGFHGRRGEMMLVSDYAGTVQTWRLLQQPRPDAVAFGASCVGSSSLELTVNPGDQPQLGGSHRVRVTGTDNAALNLLVLGLSRTQYGGAALPLTIPLGTANCQLRVSAELITALGVGLPALRLLTVPNVPSLLGERYMAQALQFTAAGVTDASNGLEVQIGLPLPENQLREDFQSAQNREPLASGDTWGAGQVTPARLGGDGRHGSFDPSFGTAVGGGVFDWNTDGQAIPASATLDGQPALVTDGRFFFTDMVVPAGITVRFVGSLPAQVFVRGQVRIDGTVSVDAAPLPGVDTPAGRVSTFSARGGSPGSTVVLAGQPGGLGGAGGGRGGKGGNEAPVGAPVIVAGVNTHDGESGADVRLLAGHAYIGSTLSTGGRGSPMHPASGTGPASAASPMIGATQFRSWFSRGGSGGGFMVAGGAPGTPTLSLSVFQFPAGTIGPAVPTGVPFPLLPFPSSPPPGYSSLNHYLVGGSGGGGGGSHAYGLLALVPGEPYMAGSAGSGGGGALLLRSGGSQILAATGSITARGGAGVVITGDDPATPVVTSTFGISSPGGGGSGGSVLLQSAAAVLCSGEVNTSGGLGSRVASALHSGGPPVVSQAAGAGSSGNYRLEAPARTFTGTGVPAFQASVNDGALTDRDDRSGSRSAWLLPAATALPVYLRYELLLEVNGLPVLLSDDPSVSPQAADDPLGPAQLRFQGARVDAVTGQALPGTLGPWRQQLRAGERSVNRDRAEVVRFDLVLNQAPGQVVARQLRIVWR